MYYDAGFLKGKRILITGASKGIGLELVSQLAHMGANLVLAARNETRLNEAARVVRDYGFGKILICPADVGTQSGVRAVVYCAKEELGGVDVLVINAGIFHPYRFQKLPLEYLVDTMALNFFQLPYFLMALQEKAMVLEKLVVISSLVALKELPGLFHYTASKAALTMATRCLRHEPALYGTTVSIVYPPTTITEGLQEQVEARAAIPELAYAASKGPTLTAEQVAKIIVEKAIIKGREEIFCDWRSWVLARMQRFFPGLVDWMIREK